jgi:hypothetical protein
MEGRCADEMERLRGISAGIVPEHVWDTLKGMTPERLRGADGVWSMDALADELRTVLLPYAIKQERLVKEKNIRFVHYTSAEKALKIFHEKRWMLRNTKCMNDYREFEHGLEQLMARRKRLVEAVGQCGEGVDRDVDQFFNELPDNRTNVYVTCFSQHYAEDDRYGRLSMWRAYGRASVGVAIVLRHESFWLTNDALKAFASPVAYLDEEEFEQQFSQVVNNIGAHCEFLRTVPRQQLLNFLFHTLLFAATCTKHPGFKEEREWRIIHFPKRQRSAVLEKSIATIHGVPQLVYKIPLKDIPEQNLQGLELQNILDRVIIGPSNYPETIHGAFISELSNAGVADAEEKVHISDIPLRF